MTVALCLLTWNEIDGVKHDVPLIDKAFGEVESVHAMEDKNFSLEGGA